MIKFIFAPPLHGRGSRMFPGYPDDHHNAENAALQRYFRVPKLIS
ncbi:hypothetical protein HCH_00669 [Hahella chejuensis KCTC 2396]|uniref:Uncharacterized protein n=1 Tax=Hahella chejuensis (strain KCTC 2396) TaxID=349521 RepID=Q2SP55_HAHCH|nr:hypothetical protein HCH_00669 [Hahella chejuensis KCTC 2396]